MPSCSSELDDGSYPPSPTQNAADDTRETVHVLFGTRHVAVTSVNAAEASGSGEIAAYPDQFELISGVTAAVRAPNTREDALAVAVPPAVAASASTAHETRRRTGAR